jgi:hypothetical protein
MFDVGVPPASVLCGDTINDECVLTIISLRTQRMKAPFTINQFLNSLTFIRVVMVLKLMTFSNCSHFDHCTLYLDGPAMKYTARHHSSSATSIVPHVLPLTYISVQGVRSLMSSAGNLSLLGAELALLRAKGWILAPRSKLISLIDIYTTYYGFFSHQIKELLCKCLFSIMHYLLCFMLLV